MERTLLFRNEDDLTIKLSEITYTCSVINDLLDTGGSISSLMVFTKLGTVGFFTNMRCIIH